MTFLFHWIPSLAAAVALVAAALVLRASIRPKPQAGPPRSPLTRSATRDSISRA